MRWAWYGCYRIERGFTGVRTGKLQRSQVLREVESINRAQFVDASIEITDTTVADDIPDWDSVAHVQIMVAIENRFGVLFDAEEYTAFADVGEMIDCICDKLVRKDVDDIMPANAAPSG